MSRYAIQQEKRSIMTSEMNLEADILQPISLEEWPHLQDHLKDDWPKYSNYYYWVENCIKWKKRMPDLALEIYCPHGKYEDDATFVGISSFSMLRIQVFTKEPSGKKLFNAMVQTKRFDWSKEITFISVHDYIQPIFFSVLDTLRTNRGIEIDNISPNCFYIKPAEEAAQMEVNVPEKCYIRDLNSSHIPIIHSLWPLNLKETPEISMKYIEVTLALNESVGLFLRKGDILVSWALQTEWYGVGIVQTPDAYQRRGYARVVVSALAKRLGKEGISPVLTVICGNTPSENMFASLNWKRTSPTKRVAMKKLA